MIDGIISLIICYLAKGWYQPYFDLFTQNALAKGYALEAIQKPLSLLELSIQITLFIVVYGIIFLIKYFLKKY